MERETSTRSRVAVPIEAILLVVIAALFAVVGFTAPDESAQPAAGIQNGREAVDPEAGFDASPPEGAPVEGAVSAGSAVKVAAQRARAFYVYDTPAVSRLDVGAPEPAENPFHQVTGGGRAVSLVVEVADTPTTPAVLTSTPRGADDLVDLASPGRRTHILDGDATGGGHRWPGASPDKTPFPQTWTDDQVMHHVSDIATDPGLKWNWTKGGPSGYTRAGDPGRASVFGVRDGVCIKVVVEPAGEGIITAHPSPGSC
ncbi:MAG: EndoU domain-containing protein [Microthrixaceae bacterium]